MLWSIIWRREKIAIFGNFFSCQAFEDAKLVPVCRGESL